MPTKHKGRKPGDWLRMGAERGRRARTMRDQFRCFCSKLVGANQAAIIQHFASGKCR